jgi:hypothetical protein
MDLDLASDSDWPAGVRAKWEASCEVFSTGEGSPRKN